MIAAVVGKIFPNKPLGLDDFILKQIWRLLERPLSVIPRMIVAIFSFCAAFTQANFYSPVNRFSALKIETFKHFPGNFPTPKTYFGRNTATDGRKTPLTTLVSYWEPVLRTETLAWYWVERVLRDDDEYSKKNPRQDSAEWHSWGTWQSSRGIGFACAGLLYNDERICKSAERTTLQFLDDAVTQNSFN